jgi:hypothetical protein
MCSSGTLALGRWACVFAPTKTRRRGGGRDGKETGSGLLAGVRDGQAKEKEINNGF